MDEQISELTVEYDRATFRVTGGVIHATLRNGVVEVRGVAVDSTHSDGIRLFPDSANVVRVDLRPEATP